MLHRVDRVLLVVPNRDTAVQRWERLFGAVQVGEYASSALGANVSVVQAGESEFEFLEPDGQGGPARTFANSWQQGLFGAGFSTLDRDALASHLESEGVEFAREGERLVLDASQTFGMPTVISPHRERERIGNISFLYEVTNPVPDWRAASDRYARIFGLDQSRFCRIKSDRYGYDGTLTLFDPPSRLDRIEITQTFGGGAMDRFFERRGPSLYMCYIEVEDVIGLGERLEANEARFAYAEGRPTGAGLFIHPSALFGMLMGVSATDYAWVWSGHPELGGPLAKDDPGVH